jgi:hypothetical protein
MAAPVRVKAGYKTKAFIQVAGNWQEADQNFVQKAGVGAITAIVRIQGSNNDFVLAAGHVFRDVDLNKRGCWIQITPTSSPVVRPIGELLIHRHW